MLIVVTSPTAVAPGGLPDLALVDLLRDLQAAGNPCGVISNHPEPGWFAQLFAGTRVAFIQQRGRQNGAIVVENAQRFGLEPYDCIVLATTLEDVQMGKNARAVLVEGEWSQDPHVRGLGIKVADAAELREVVRLTEGWSGDWWFAGNAANYSVRALTDLSSKGAQGVAQQVFATRVTSIVKGGGPHLNALLTVVARTLLKSGVAGTDNLMWGVYPSSASRNDDQEVLSDFTHRLRTTVSQVRYAKRGEPLFCRHRPSAKRSRGDGGSRLDPTDQIESIHLNPFYRKSLKGRNVIVIDDCTTYGVSFGVAAALLRKAGASSVMGVALGKFGRQLHRFEIDVISDPFAPVGAGGYTCKDPVRLSGTENPIAQDALRTLFP